MARLRTRARVPPPLCRQNALRPVRFTACGKRHARKILLDTEGGGAYYYASQNLAGDVRHSLLGRGTVRTFAQPADMPEWEYADGA